MATRVAEALGIALGAGERERLAERPTRNVAAYDAYLHALEERRTDAPSAAAEFERAIALDSGFALAWAELALTRQYFSTSGSLRGSRSSAPGVMLNTRSRSSQGCHWPTSPWGNTSGGAPITTARWRSTPGDSPWRPMMCGCLEEWWKLT